MKNKGLNRLLSLVLAVVMVLSCTAVALAAEVNDNGGVFASGTGTKDDPFLIKTVEQLKAFAASVNGGTTYKDQYVRLEADLDISGSQWTPIGGETADFCGDFDGSGYAISGLTIGQAKEPADLEYVGLFGSIGANGAVRNLGVADVKIINRLNDVDNRPMVGALAASLGKNAIVDACWASGMIASDAKTDQYSYIGGLVAATELYSVISNSWTDVKILGAGNSDNFVGGIVGQVANKSLIVNCAAFGAVEDYGGTSLLAAAGGVAGACYGAVYNCYAMGDVYQDATDWGDGEVGAGNVVGNTPWEIAAYDCFFSTDAKLACNSGELEPRAVGFDTNSYCLGDNTYCYGKKADYMGTERFAEDMNKGLADDEIAKAQAYFGKDVDFAALKALAVDGWLTWELWENGRVLPGSPVEPGCEHEYAVTEVVLPTCTAAGYKVYTCAKCADSYQEELAVIPCAADTFHDLNKDSWYHDAVDYAVYAGLFNGTGPDTFHPGMTMSRGMLVTVIYRMAGCPEADGTLPFTDVDSTLYYADAVIWAAKNGIVKGVSATEFAPDAPVTREQMMAILLRYAAFKGYAVEDRADLSGYTDSGIISPYALEAVQWAVGAGLVNGRTETTLEPGGYANRAEVAAILTRFIAKVVK